MRGKFLEGGKELRRSIGSLLLHVEDDTADDLAFLQGFVCLLECGEGLGGEVALNLSTGGDVESFTSILTVTDEEKNVIIVVSL